MKVTVIGGGSSYTPELIIGFLQRNATFPIDELWLMDIDAERLALVGGFCQRIVAARGAPFTVHLCTDQRQAVARADYVITQLRVGKIAARRQDEYLGRRHGLIGQETTGVGGMAKALRTIPVILNLARDMQELAPDALLVNFTNPAGLITEALSRYAPGLAAVGVCNVPITTRMDFLHILETQRGENIALHRTQLETLGLNHLSWHRGFRLDGEDVWEQLFPAYVTELAKQESPEIHPETIETLGVVPNDYLQYYYYTNRKLAAQQAWPPSRAEQVMKIEAELLRLYADPTRIEPPPELMQRGGAYYSTLATHLLNAHYNDLGQVFAVNVRHGGAVPGWPQDWVLEMPCRIDAAGVHPLPAQPLPPVFFGLLTVVKMYEILTVEAAVHGDRDAAYQALLVHPLGPEEDKIVAVLDDMLTTHQAYLPQFVR